jgi:hypothetical protein
MDGVLENNTFRSITLGFGEYAAHWTLTGNHISLYPDANLHSMMALGGFDVLFANNNVMGSGTVPLIADHLGVGYGQYCGQIRIIGNALTCGGDSNPTCIIAIATLGLVFSDNMLDIPGHGNVAMKIEGGADLDTVVQRNKITGAGIVINPSGSKDACIIEQNVISGHGYGIGIYVNNPPTPRSGGHIISRNIITGFDRAVDYDPAIHPGTTVDSY